MKTLSFRFLVVFLCVFLPQMVCADFPIGKITFYTENYPPANFQADKELKGISIDTLKTLWKHMNMPEQQVLLVPWARGYRFTLDNKNTALFTMFKTQPRESLFKWVGPVFQSTHVLVAKKHKGFKFNSLGQTFYHRIAAVEGDISEISLHQIGFPSSIRQKFHG